MHCLRKFKAKIVANILWTLFCLLGLLYQSIQLLTQYTSGNTVVNVEVKREVYENLPAFTFCFPYILSLESTVNFDDSYDRKQYYEEYWKIIKEIKTNDTLHGHYKFKMNFIYSQSDTIYHKYFYKPEFADFVMNNLSLPYKLTENFNSSTVAAVGTLSGK